MASVGLSVFMAICPWMDGIRAMQEQLPRHVSQQMAIVLCKRRNATMGVDRLTLWALLWCSATALQHLTRTMAIACVLCLVAKHHSNAEPINTMLLEY